MGGNATVGIGRRVVAIAFGAGMVAAVLALGPGVAPASAACPNAGAKAHEVPLPKLRKAIICLVNRERSKRDRSRLDPNRKLTRAAQDHTDVMLTEDCLRHNCPGEPGLGHRIKRSGYTKGQRSWRFAEDLGFAKTPRRMVKLWLAAFAISAPGSAGGRRGGASRTPTSPPTRSSSPCGARGAS
jgi:hypothetical protein